MRLLIIILIIFFAIGGIPAYERWGPYGGYSSWMLAMVLICLILLGYI